MNRRQLLKLGAAVAVSPSLPVKAAAVTSVSGFMIAADKVKLDAIYWNNPRILWIPPGYAAQADAVLAAVRALQK